MAAFADVHQLPIAVTPYAGGGFLSLILGAQRMRALKGALEFGISFKFAFDIV